MTMKNLKTLLFFLFVFTLFDSSKVFASWTLETIPNTPAIDHAVIDRWGTDGYAIINRGNNRTYLYIYGRHSTTLSNSMPSTYRLHMMKWNNDLRRFENHSILANGVYLNTNNRFYNGGFDDLSTFENGVYRFEHEAVIGGHSNREAIDTKITYSNWITVGGRTNRKVALLYYDEMKNDTDLNANDSKLRIRDAQNRNRLRTATMDYTNGLILDIEASMTVIDSGDDVTDNNNGTLSAFSTNEWHIKNNHLTTHVDSTIYLKSPNGTDLYSTSNGTRYSNGINAQYRYGKSGLNIPINELRKLDVGEYPIDMRLDVDSGGAASQTRVRSSVSNPSNVIRSINLIGSDGGARRFRLQSNNSGNLVLVVSDIESPTGNITASPSGWTNRNVTIRLSNIQDTGGSGYHRTRLPNGTFITTTSHDYTVSSNGTYEFVIYDHAGNSTTLMHTVSKIDKTNPNGSITPSTTSWTNQNIILTVNGSDDQSGISHVIRPDGSQVNSSAVTYTVERNGTYTFEVVDRAGNSRVISRTITNIDKEPPSELTISIEK